MRFGQGPSITVRSRNFSTVVFDGRPTIKVLRRLLMILRTDILFASLLDWRFHLMRLFNMPECSKSNERS